MARLSEEAAERGLQLFKKSDEELGRYLADLHREALERAACEVAGIDSMFSGTNWLLEPPENWTARRLIEYLTDLNLDAALRFDSGTPQALAIWLALRGDYERAGRAMRKSTSYAALVAHCKRESGQAKMRLTKLDKQIQRVTEWARIGVEFRKNERGPRMDNTALAKMIEGKTGDSWHSIRLELPKLGLDKESWPVQKPVKSVLRKRQQKKSRNFATLKR